MTTIYLVRHAEHDLMNSVLCGRSDESKLTAAGKVQARGLADQFMYRSLHRVESSPRQRTRDTAIAIAEPLGLPVIASDELDELDAGMWTGQRFASLAGDRHWLAWNEHRSRACPPRGESMGEMQARVARHLEALCKESDGAEVLIVSHAEPIRAAIMQHNGISLDRFHEVEIAPASISVLRARDARIEVAAVNRKALP